MYTAEVKDAEGVRKFWMPWAASEAEVLASLAKKYSNLDKLEVVVTKLPSEQ